MRKNTIPVSGMHCKACEVLLEKTIRNLDGVEKVSASQSKGAVEVSYEGTVPDWNAVESVITENGYSIGNKKDLPWFQTDASEYETVFVSAIAIGALYYLAKFFGFSFGGVGTLSTPTLSVAFLIGLTAGVSSCMALVGGLVLGISAKWNAKHANEGGWSRFQPHVLFNLGRVLGFGFFGGLLGAFGSFIGFSNVFVGLVTLAVGVLMLLLGLNLTNLSPRLGDVSVTLPKFLGKNLGSDASGPLGTMATGALTFFLPCGFTLAMQVYAVSTGSFMVGAMTMALFALGTAPGLLSVGGLTSFFKGESAKAFFKFTGVVVLALAFFNIANGYNLLSLGSPKPAPVADIDTSKLETQEVRMVEDDNGYSPSVIKIRPNTKIRLVIDAKAPFSCASQFTIPSVGVRKQLEAGENVIEFVSPASGTVRFSCSMGMYTGKFVVEGTSGVIGTPGAATASASVSDDSSDTGNSGRGMAGCSMMGNR